MDKAGAVYDALFGMDGDEEDGWITTENGKKVHLKDGEIDKGNVRQKNFSYKLERLESTAPDMALYNNLLKKNEVNFKKAAHEYFKEKLQGRYVLDQTDKGPIEVAFMGETWTELKKNIGNDPIKAALVPYLPDIIVTANTYKSRLLIIIQI